MLSRPLGRRDRNLDVFVSDIYTESILTSFIWGKHHGGTWNVHPSTGTASSSSSTSSVPTTTPSYGSKGHSGQHGRYRRYFRRIKHGVVEHDGFRQICDLCIDSISGGVSSTTQKNGYSSSSSYANSGSLPASTTSVASSRPSTVLRPIPATTSETTSEPILTILQAVAYHNHGYPQCRQYHPTTILMPDFLSSPTFNRPNGLTRGSTSTFRKLARKSHGYR